MSNTVIGVFKYESDASAAIDEFKKMGYDAKDISVVMKDHTKVEGSVKETKISQVSDGAAAGAMSGGIIGAFAGLLVGIGAITIPGIGAVLIGGPLAAALGLTGAAATTASGAVTGALAGGVVGALTGLGVPQDEAQVYEREIKSGAILIAVPTRDRGVDEVTKTLEEYNATQIRSIQMPSEYEGARSAM